MVVAVIKRITYRVVLDKQFAKTYFWCACGFTYAVIYLNSRNIFIPMLLHFVYDVIAKIMEYAVEWEQYPICMTLWNGINVAYVVMFVISVLMLFVDLREENR